MVQILKKILIILIIIKLSPTIWAQELRGLQYNPILDRVKQSTKMLAQKLPVDTISIPFFEDFSDYKSNEIYPRHNKWINNYAYINSSFPDSMISLGVATLDAYDPYGMPYHSNLKQWTPSDTLTSVPIQFNGITKNVFFSFFYEAGGKGDMPEEMDSLYVEFLSPDSLNWDSAYCILGGDWQHHFNQVVLAVDSKYCFDGFQFRFRNATSRGISIEDKASNADQWHIDYIQLKVAENDAEMRSLNDMTITEPLLPTFIGYNTVPYRHLQMAYGFGNNKRGNIPLVVRNNYNNTDSTISTGRRYISYNMITNQVISTLPRFGDGGIENTIPPMSVYKTYDSFTDYLVYEASDTIGKMKLTALILIDSDPNQKSSNDTVSREELYYDYYAYDDGSSELGYGISGEQQDTVEIALGFRNFRRSDTLRGIYLYFNKSVDTSTYDIDFKVCAWEADKGLPGKVLYQSEEMYTPTTTHSIGEYTRIDFTKPIVVKDTVFIGIKQPSTRFINLGYDLNYNSKNALFVKTNSNNWYNDAAVEAGSVMIRPSFGKYHFSIAPTNELVTSKPSVYPNPARELLHINFPDESPDRPLHIKIIDLTGKVLHETYSNGSEINVSGLNKGMYFLMIYSERGSEVSTLKFIKD